MRDHLRTGLRIEEAVTDDLTDQFLRAPVVRSGAALGTEQSSAAFFEEELSELEVALAAETELGGGVLDARRAAFALDEHGKLARDFVIGGNGQGAEFALDTLFEELQRNHRISWAECHD